MSRGFPPRGRGTSSAGNRGRGGFSGGGFRGGRGGAGGNFPMGPPDQVFEMGKFMHACEGDMVYESTNPKIPYFNAPIYLENKSLLGKVDEVLGPMNQVYFTVKPTEGIVATSFNKGDKVFIGGDKLLPMERFLPKPKAPSIKKPGERGAGRGAADRGRGRGGFSRGGRGGFTPGRGGTRGNFGGGGRGGARRGRAPSGSFRGRGRGSY